MTPLEREIRRQRAALLRIEQNGASAIVGTYERVQKRLAENLALLTAEIEHARGQGIEVRPGWLFAQQRYHSLLSDLQAETLNFLHRAIATITGAQREAVTRAPADADDLILSALGHAPRNIQATLRHRFGTFPTAAFERLVGYAGDGKPLGFLLAEIAPKTVQDVRDSLAYGVATGQSPRVIADDVTIKAGIARTRALTIARTEVLRAYRTTTRERFEQSKVVETWTWLASLDGRCCPSCVAMNGTVHPVTEDLNSHANCRCVAAPNPPSWAALGFHGIPDSRPSIPDPQEAFAALPEPERLAILGRARLDAYNRGEITLADMVHETHSQRWGPGRRAATLAELGIST